jgi:pyruvate dehydrogenase E2 component (dihydrolipoamide acetyltransferase)
MAFEVVLPRLGWSMDTGSLVAWLKADGETVNAGEILFTAEGDKAVQEVEALDSGTLYIPPDSPEPGVEIPVGTILGYVLLPGEQPPPAEARATRFTPAATAQPADAGVAPHQAHLTPAATAERAPAQKPKISPRARRVAGELGIDWTTLKGTGRTGRIVERDVRAAAQARVREPQLEATPVARRLAATYGVDLAALAARAPGRKITREDVEAAVRARETPAAVPEPAIAEAMPITQLRRVIARRMLDSAQSTAAVTLTTEADATDLVALRERFRAALEPRGRPLPSYTDLIIKLLAVALAEHPIMNASWRQNEIVIADGIHIAVAVDTDEGLLVPVIRDVPSKSIQQIAEETRRLADQARSRDVTPDALQGGTFTVTNLGMYGVDAFTPLINLPQCAVLGVGRIIRKPAVRGDELVPRHMVALSLTFDHRVVDGGPAARFLQTVREYVEEPHLWLAM